MSKPNAKITRTIGSEQVLNAFVEVVRKNLPLELKNTRITADDIIYALAYANVHRLSIEKACDFGDFYLDCDGIEDAFTKEEKAENASSQ